MTVGGTIGGVLGADAYTNRSTVSGTLNSGFDVVAGAIAVAPFDSTFTVSPSPGTADAVAVLAVVPCSTVDAAKDNAIGEGTALDTLTEPAVVTVCATIKPPTAPDEAKDIVVGEGSLDSWVDLLKAPSRAKQRPTSGTLLI